MDVWVQNLCFTVVGTVLGIGADEIKRWLSRQTDLRLAKREIYDELAVYIADLEKIWGDRERRDFSEYVRVRQVPPRLDIINWYTANRFDLLLRLDTKKGIRKLYRDIEASIEKSEVIKGIPEQSSLLKAVNEEQYDLDNSYLKQLVRERLKASGFLKT
jgi:hypothetical protein